MLKYLTLALLCLSPFVSWNQINITSSVQQELLVCGASSVFEVKIHNDQPTIINNISVSIQLPQGILYDTASLLDLAQSGAAESNISDLQNPVLSFNDLNSGDSIVFSIQTNAITNAVAHQQAGNIFRNDVVLTHSTGSETHQSAAYNILFPALNILSVAPSSQTAISGDTVTRAITIVNAGYGRAESIYVSDVRNGTEVILTSSNPGQLNNTNDTISLSGSDFASIGNGDAYFDLGETIVLTQKLVLSGCNATTVTSSINAHWGCEGDIITTPTSYGHVSLQLKSPNIVSTIENNENTCAGLSSKSLLLVNTGQGYARNIAIQIYKSSGGNYDEDIFSALDAASFTYKMGASGSPVSFSPTTTPTRDDGYYSCLGSNPIGQVDYILPFDLAPSDSVIIEWDVLQCCISSCLGQGNTGWKYSVDYEDYCLTSNYTKNGTGEDATELNMTVFTESPTDIDDGETRTFNYIISSHDNNLPLGDGAYYKVTFTLPDGLIWNNAPGTIRFLSNSTIWPATSVVYNNFTNVIEASYTLPEPFKFEKSEIQIDLTGDCSGSVTSGSQTVSMDIDFVADTTCSNICVVNMICNKQVSVDLHCPIFNCEGIHFYGFDMARTSFGTPDNDENGLPDASGSLDFNNVRTNRAMYGDSLMATFKGYVNTGTNQSSFSNLFAQTAVEMGSFLTPTTASVKIFDASTGSYLTCNNVTLSYFDNGTERTFRYNFLPASSTCPSVQSYVFEQGDSVWLYAHYRVSGNNPGGVDEVKMTNNFFASQQTVPWSNTSDWLSCDSYNGRYTLIGYFFKNHLPKNYTLTSCSKVVSQNFSLSIGDCCDNYHGGNLFPYEYRNWAHLKSLEIHVPNHYRVLDVYLKHKRTVATNSISTQTINGLVQSNNSLSTLIFDLEQYYEEFGGNLYASDDGFRGTVYLELAPTCDVAVNTYEDINWKIKFSQSDFLGGGETAWITASPDKIKFTPTSLTLASNNPIQDGLGRTVTWNLKVKNPTSNSDADNAWLHFKSPSGEVLVEHVIASNGDTLVQSGDIYQIGAVNKNSTLNFSVVGSYNGCSPDYLVAYSGYECAAYPDSFAYFSCPYTTFPLHVEPKNAGAQARISGNTIGGDCSNLVEITVEMSSVHFGYLDSIEVEITPVGNSMVFESGTGEMSYPTNNSYTLIQDPDLISTNYLYKIAQLNSTINENGLPGVTDLSSNTFRLRFQMLMDPGFQAGDHVQIALRSTEICGAPIAPIYLAYDPSIVFSKNTLTGLTDLNTDTWGAAWVDFNNDGFEDLFVSNYHQGESSKLYKNNGDGTFTSHNAGSLTSESINTVSSTWGDYDNDGDVDVFLANNVGSANKLYSNNGDGTFSIDPSLAINTYGGYCHNAAWIDYDNDGYLDLFVTDYMPTKYNLLYHNNGNGDFTKINNQIIAGEAMKSIGSTWADYDNDGDLDAFVPNTNGENNALYQNNGNGNFSKITTGDVVTDGGNSVGCSWGDYNNDGYLDLFVANTGVESNFLYANAGDGTFVKVTNDPLVNDQYHSSGSSWIDVDNDGDLDLYVTNDLGDPAVLYSNDGTGSFAKLDNPLSDVQGNSYPNAWGDYDNDGDLDVFIGNHSQEKDVVLTNGRASCNSWLCLELEGTSSNKNAIGAKIRVKSTVYGSDVWQMREISSQTGGGAGSQNSMKVLFGLGDANTIDSVIIEWPSGIKQYLTSLSPNGCQTVIEPTGNLICGRVFNDENGNCIQDNGEEGIPNLMLEISPGQMLVTTNASGDYQVYVEDGSFTIAPLLSGNWSNTCSNSATLSLTGHDSCGVSFGATNGCANPDLSIILGTTAMRRGFTNMVSVTYKNESPVMATGITLNIEFDNEIIPLSADIPWDYTLANGSTTTYSWFLDTVPAYSNVNFMVVDSVDQNAELDSMVTVLASFNNPGGDCNTQNDTYTDINPVVGSVDPNDKLVYPSKSDGILQITSGTRLTYKIRFQNVGTYMASRVIIVDTLSSYLDPTTIEFLETSHPFTISLENNVLIWQAFDIELPDSTTDLMRSQGFVSFSILPKVDAPHNSLVINRASIKFDYNEDIITNRVYTKIVSMDVLNQIELVTDIYPNPTSSDCLIKLMTSDRENYVPMKSLHLFNTSGKLLRTIEIDEKEQVRLDISSLEKGLYKIWVEDIFGRKTWGKIIKM